MKKRIVCWFSCGAASAVATKLTLDHFKDDPDHEVVVVRNIVREEHPDNDRFAKDCEDWFGVPIINTINEEYDGSIYNVFLKRKYMAGIYGAPCTMLLKKEVRKRFERHDDTHVFGFTVDEEHRLERLFDNNNSLRTFDVLIDRELTHADCLGILTKEGIDLPVMYKLGYKTNNCLGCVKGGAGYWNKIREDFPEAFDRACQVSRQLGAKLIKVKGKRVFLDELPKGVGRYAAEPEIQCGILCETEWRGLQADGQDDDDQDDVCPLV